MSVKLVKLTLIMVFYRIRRKLRTFSRFHWIIMGAIALNLFIYYLLSSRSSMLVHQDYEVQEDYEEELSLLDVDKDIMPRSLTVVISEFEDFENRVVETVETLYEMIPDVQIVVLADKRPYPPINLPSYATLVTQQIPIDKPQVMSRPEMYIKTEYVMFLPDGCEAVGAMAIQMMIDFFEKQPSNVKSVAWAATVLKNTKCLGLDPNLKQWTIKYSEMKGDICDAVQGDFVILTKREYLFRLAEPFARPLAIAYFVQTALRGWKVTLYRDLTFLQRHKMFTDSHNNWKHKTKELERTEDLYEHFGIKLVYNEDGAEEWYGCNKRTKRCFGTIVNDMPEYVAEGRWTPPCCLKALRMTARHVFSVLESQGVRFWLEGGTLLGAARHGDIIPWDYDVDVGIYKEDIPKCRHLMQTGINKPFIDMNGFVWEHAPEGDFFRVQFSEYNRLHIDIHPFYSVNGNMTKDTWIKSHRQDMPFPEHYLNPLTRIDFVGIKTFAPNNWRDFLELKFGKGAIENPKYPDTSKVV